MPGTEFAALVAAVAEGMGQRPDAVKGTADAFLFAFIEDPDRLSLSAVDRILADPRSAGGRLLLLTPGRIPLAFAQRIAEHRGSLVEHERFRELLRGLDLGPLL